jgi:hypothetical protein
MLHFKMDKESYLDLLIKSTAGNVYLNVTLPGTLQDGQRITLGAIE